MRKRRIMIALAVVFALPVLWFLAVDWSWFVEDCPDCGYGREIMQYRVFGFSIHERAIDDPTVVQRIAADLGMPCEHPGLSRWHKHRLWGLWHCAAPCINGIYRVVGAEWYDGSVAGRVKALADAHPDLGHEFHRRVIREHDMDYWHAFMDQIRSEPQ